MEGIWPVVTIGGCVIGTVRATLWEISPQKKVPRREVESFFREERNVTTGLVSFTHHRIQIITILAGTDIAKKTFKLDSFWWDDAII